MNFEYNPGAIRDRLRTDGRLRNLTIYAQWVSVTAAVLLYFPTFYALYCYLVILTSDEVHSFTSLLLLTLDLGPLNLLYPLLPLGLELPHYIRSKPILYWSTATCLAMPPRYFVTLFAIATGDPSDDSAKIVIAIYISLILMAFTFIVTMVSISAIHVPAQPSTIESPSSSPDPVQMRVGINLMYCMQLGFPVISSSFYRFRAEGDWVNGFMSLLFWLTACLFGVAALLYVAASKKRHSWISSTLFGGTGIKPMVLWLPGTEPSHQSIGNEAQEGAVRLA